MIKINLRNEIYSKQDYYSIPERKNRHTIIEFIRHYFYFDRIFPKRFRASCVPSKIDAIKNRKITGFNKYYHLDIKRSTQILKPKGE